VRVATWNVRIAVQRVGSMDALRAEDVKAGPATLRCSSTASIGWRARCTSLCRSRIGIGRIRPVPFNKSGRCLTGCMTGVALGHAAKGMPR